MRLRRREFAVVGRKRRDAPTSLFAFPTVSGLRVRHIGLEDPGVRPGGLNRYLGDLVEAEQSRGVDARGVVLGRKGSSPSSTSLDWADVMTAPLPKRLLSMARVAWKLPLPDVVDAHFALYALLPVLTRLRRRPLVVHFQGPWADESSTEGGSGINAFVKRRIERSVYRRADRVVVLSRAFEALVAERYGVPAELIRRVPPGVDATRFAPGDAERARRQLGVDLDRFVVVVVRRLRNRMGIEIAIDAIRLLGDHAELVIVGEGPERDRLEGLATSLNAPVRFVGRVSDEDLALWYHAADVSVVPTIALEGFGLVVLESLACGTPVIASDLDGLRDATEGFDGAVLVPPGNPSALADALRAVSVGDIPSAESCRRHALGHSWSEIAKLHLDIYEEIAPRARKRRVAVVGHTAALSGGELAMARLMPAVNPDHEVTVILAEDGPLVGRLEAEGIEVEVLPMAERTRNMGRSSVVPGIGSIAAAFRTLRYSLVLARRLRELRPDVVHTNTLKAALYGGVAARLARTPEIIWHLRDRIAADYLPSSAVRLVRWAARCLPDGIVANSTATLETLGRLTVPSLVLPSPLEPTVTTQRSSRPDGGVRFGVIGRLAPWKGQMMFLEAFATAFPDERGGPTAVIVGSALFGEDDYVTNLEDEIARLGLADRVELLGFKEDIATVLSHLDVLVHSSLIAEPFGQVVIEGMGAGLCVVAANAGGPAETITDGVDGLLYEMANSQALTEVLRRVEDDALLRSELGIRAAEAADSYRPDRLAARLLDFYDEIGPQR